jgi:hypothetical protein
VGLRRIPHVPRERPLLAGPDRAYLVNGQPKNLPLGAYLPERAFVQVKGTIPTGDVQFDYAVHVGNSSTHYITTSTVGTWVPGQDTTSLKAVGGRVGLRWSGLKAGVSCTYDRDSQSNLTLGDLPRTRVGFDLSYTIAGFTAQGEYIAADDHGIFYAGAVVQVGRAELSFYAWALPGSRLGVGC